MNRYWVGGSGVWSDSNHWSESSGGVGGASVPDEGDDVYIDSNSGFASGGTILVNYAWCKDFICTSGHTYTIKMGEYGGLFVGGSFELEPSITWDSLPVSFTGNGTIKTSGVKLDYISIGVVYS